MKVFYKKIVKICIFNFSCFIGKGSKYTALSTITAFSIGAFYAMYAMYAMKLKKNFKKYFWEYNFNELSDNVDKYRMFIAERLLNFGDISAIKWLKKYYLLNEILDIVKKSRNIDKITKNYWLTIYDTK